MTVHTILRAPSHERALLLSSPPQTCYQSILNDFFYSPLHFLVTKATAVYGFILSAVTLLDSNYHYFDWTFPVFESEFEHSKHQLQVKHEQLALGPASTLLAPFAYLLLISAQLIAMTLWAVASPILFMVGMTVYPFRSQNYPTIEPHTPRSNAPPHSYTDTTLRGIVIRGNNVPPIENYNEDDEPFFSLDETPNPKFVPTTPYVPPQRSQNNPETEQPPSPHL